MLLIYLPFATPRSDYVFELIFKQHLGIEYTITNDSGVFAAHTEEKINYSSLKVSDEIFIKASSFLLNKSIENIIPVVLTSEGRKFLFPNNDADGCEVGFDIFASIFYMASRYEEYLPFTPDTHGRFKAEESLAYKNNFLQKPIVNIWIEEFKNILIKKYPGLKFRSEKFKATITYDIDVAYAFKGKSIINHLLSIIKDITQLNFTKIRERLNYLLTGNDPWDTYSFLENTIKKNHLNTIFFFLLGDKGKYDRNIPYDNLASINLINKISEFSDIGIHPSYLSSVLIEKIATEKRRLENISNKKIIKSRQHFLRFELPVTFNHLLSAGIKEDYSMGFTGLPGFRAGLCTPFYFYDLSKEIATDLIIHPVAFMEGTFIDYMQKNPEESIKTIFELISEVKQVTGNFISIWHNHTVSDTKMYKDWKMVHNKMIEQIISYY